MIEEGQDTFSHERIQMIVGDDLVGLETLNNRSRSARHGFDAREIEIENEPRAGDFHWPEHIWSRA